MIDCSLFIAFNLMLTHADPTSNGFFVLQMGASVISDRCAFLQNLHSRRAKQTYHRRKPFVHFQAAGIARQSEHREVSTMIQAEVGGAARIDPGTGLQRPGHMIRDFELPSSTGGRVRISNFRGRRNLFLVFPAHSDAMRAVLEEASKSSS